MTTSDAPSAPEGPEIAKLRSILLDMKAQLADIARTPKGMPLSQEMVQTCFAIFGFVHEHDIANLFPEKIPGAALHAATAPQPERMFSIQGGPDIPWSVIAPFDKQCQRNHGGQTLEDLHRRGGLGVFEALAVLHAEDWDKRYPSNKPYPSKEALILELVALVKERQAKVAATAPQEGHDQLQGLRNAKYLNPVCAEDGCQWLRGIQRDAIEDAVGFLSRPDREHVLERLGYTDHELEVYHARR